MKHIMLFEFVLLNIVFFWNFLKRILDSCTKSACTGSVCHCQCFNATPDHQMADWSLADLSEKLQLFMKKMQYLLNTVYMYAGKHIRNFKEDNECIRTYV